MSTYKVVAIATLFKLLNVMNADLSASFQIIVSDHFNGINDGKYYALRQVNVKRMLAYSGISHAGFMLMTLLSVSNAAGIYCITLRLMP
jgi:NADH-quinone oxidoreductase subunit N